MSPTPGGVGRSNKPAPINIAAIKPAKINKPTIRLPDIENLLIEFAEFTGLIRTSVIQTAISRLLN